MQSNRSQDLDLRLGQALPTPETGINLTSIDGQGQAHQQSAGNYWLQCIHKWYPHLHSQTYFLPPLHFNRVPYCVENIAGKQVLVPQTPQSVSAGRRNHGNLTLPPVSDSDVRDDRALQRVLHGMRSLADNGQQKEALCQCLGVQSVDDAVKLCLLSDQLSDKQMPSEIKLWWQHLVRASITEPSMTSALYDQLLARFCGPATTVEVHSVTAPRLNIRTLGEGVSETGERGARLVLFLQQVDILNRSPPRAFLNGPPGTGKTIVLIMQGLTWLQRGHDVHVVSTWKGSYAATTIIEHQLQELAKTSTVKPRVHRHQFDFKKAGEMEVAVRRLKSLTKRRQLYLIADEVVRYRKSFTEFCDQLIERVPGVFIWCATVYHDVKPLCLEEVKLTTPLRSPPVVIREVMESWEIKHKRVHDYTVSDVPAPTDGPPVIRIKHREGQSGHIGDRPRDCAECGHQVSCVLTELDVGRTGDSNGPPPLQYRDVLVLGFYYPTDDRVDGNGKVATTASGLVRGLREYQVPVRVVEKGDEAAIRDTALGVGDLVTVANCCDVQGLERKVVVMERVIGELFDLFYRILAMSRCTSQLVLIDF